jgi:hypothetical protein
MEGLSQNDFPHDEIVSEKWVDISIPLSLKAGNSYRLIADRVEGGDACNLCVEETPRDNDNEPMKNLSKKIQCRVLQ